MFKENNPAFTKMAEEIVKDAISSVDPIKLERLHVDLLLHYLCPTEETGALSVGHAQEVIAYGSIINRLLRGVTQTNALR